MSRKDKSGRRRQVAAQDSGHGNPTPPVSTNQEEQRVDAIWDNLRHNFVPAALRALAPDAVEPELPTEEQCNAISAATVMVACLLNLPSSLVERLLTYAWSSLNEGARYEEDGLQRQSAAETKHLVNLPLDPQLLDTVVAFLYQTLHILFLPPLIGTFACTPVDPDKPSSNTISRGVCLKAQTKVQVAALLDGATPLHCAALRANPELVQLLLSFKAQPLVTSAAGDMPIQLVPMCKGKDKGAGDDCRCRLATDVNPSSCSSQACRRMLGMGGLQFRCPHDDIWAWIKMIFFNVICLMACVGCLESLERPSLESHEARRQQAKRAEAKARLAVLLHQLRTDKDAGQTALSLARKLLSTSRSQRHDLDPGDERHTRGSDGSHRPHSCRWCDELGVGVGSIWDYGDLLQKDPKRCPEQPPEAAAAAQRAFEPLDHAVLRLQSRTSLQSTQSESGDSHGQDRAGLLPDVDQASLYASWAEAALLCLRTCYCSRCALRASEVIGIARRELAVLFVRVERRKGAKPEAWRAVGAAWMQVLHCKVCILLDVETRRSATKVALQQASDCLEDWRLLHKAGLVTAAEHVSSPQVAALQSWAEAAYADLTLMHALHGKPLGPHQSVAELLPQVVEPRRMGDGMETFLIRPVTKDAIRNLETALASAGSASSVLVDLTRAAARNAAGEMQAAEALRDIMTLKGSTSTSNGLAVDHLDEAIKRAARFPHLSAECQAGLQLKERWERRAEAVAQLEDVMLDVSAPVRSIFSQLASPGSGSRPGSARTAAVDEEQPSLQSESESDDADPYWAEWSGRISALEHAIDDAKDANISVNKAKRLLKELQGQTAAAEAAMKLKRLLKRRACGTSSLRGDISRAEAAVQGATSTISGLTVGVDALAPLLHCARRQLEVEKASEALLRTVAAAQGVSDLPRLEAAILQARKLAAEELQPETYREAGELRSMLAQAAEALEQLEGAVRRLQRSGKEADAEGLQEAILQAELCGDLVTGDVAQAQEALQRWRAASTAGAKLAAALQEGASIAVLSRAIQEAAAAGVKVVDAKRILKLMQALEAALTHNASDGSLQYQSLRTRIEAAEQGGVNTGLVASARQQLLQLLLLEVQEGLDTAFKIRADRNPSQRNVAIRAALDRAETLLDSELGSGATEELLLACKGAGSEAGSSTGSEAEAAESGNVVDSEPGSPQGSCSGSDSGSKGGLSEGLAAKLELLEGSLVGNVRRLLGEANRQLELEASERARFEAERTEELRLKRERQQRERAEREKAVRDRAERDKLERERAARERADRREKEAAEQARLKAEREARAAQLRRERIMMERLTKQQAQLAAWQQQQHDLRLMALRRQYIQQHYAAVAAAAAAAAAASASAGDGGLSGGGPLQQGVPAAVTTNSHRAGPLHQGLGGLADSMQDSSLLHSSGAGSAGAEAGGGGLSAADAWAEAELLRNEREERSRLERELLKHVESMEVLPLSNEMLDMLNGSDTPGLESSASDRHSDASELPFADSHPAPQQGLHPLGNGYAAAAAAGSSVCPPSGPSRTASIRSSAASTEDVFSPRTGQGPTPLLASALSSSSGVSSHGGYGLVHKQLPTTRPAALAEAPLSALGGPAEGIAGGAQGIGLAGEPSHDCLREWAQGGGLQTHHSAEGLPNLSRRVMSPDPAAVSRSSTPAGSGTPRLKLTDLGGASWNPVATSPAGRPAMHPSFRSSGSDRLKALAAVNSAAEHNGPQHQTELNSQAAGVDPVGALGSTPHRQSFSSSMAVGSPTATGLGLSGYFSTGGGHIGSQLGGLGAMSAPGTGLHHVRVDSRRSMSPGGPCQRPRSAGSNHHELPAFTSTVMTPPAGSGWHPFMRAPQQQLGHGAVGDLPRAGRDATAAEQPGLNASLAALGIFVQDDAAPLPLSRSLSTSLSGDAPAFRPSSAGVPHTSAGPPRPRGHQGAEIQTPRTLRAQRPCRYWSQGFCRDGDRCRFAHNTLLAADAANHSAAFAVAPGSMSAAGSTPAPHFGLHLGSHDAKLSVHSLATVSSGLASTGGFAFGAPGSEAFSSHSGLHSPSVTAGRPAMLPAVPEGLPSGSAPSALLHQRGYSAGPGCTGGFYMQRGADHAMDHLAGSPFPGVGQGLPNNSTLGLLLDIKHLQGAPGLPYPPTPSISDAQEKPGSLNDAASSGSTTASNPWSVSVDSSSGTA